MVLCFSTYYGGALKQHLILVCLPLLQVLKSLEAMAKQNSPSLACAQESQLVELLDCMTVGVLGLPLLMHAIEMLVLTGRCSAVPCTFLQPPLINITPVMLCNHRRASPTAMPRCQYKH